MFFSLGLPEKLAQRHSGTCPKSPSMLASSAFSARQTLDTAAPASNICYSFPGVSSWPQLPLWKMGEFAVCCSSGWEDQSGEHVPSAALLSLSRQPCPSFLRLREPSWLRAHIWHSFQNMKNKPARSEDRSILEPGTSRRPRRLTGPSLFYLFLLNKHSMPLIEKSEKKH